MSRCWALALRCGKFVVELLWARPLVMSIGGVVQHVRSRCPCSGVWALRKRNKTIRNVFRRAAKCLRRLRYVALQLATCVWLNNHAVAWVTRNNRVVTRQCDICKNLAGIFATATPLAESVCATKTPRDVRPWLRCSKPRSCCVYCLVVSGFQLWHW